MPITVPKRPTNGAIVPIVPEQPEPRPQPLEDLEDPRVDERARAPPAALREPPPGRPGQDRRVRAFARAGGASASPAVPRAISSVRRVPSSRDRALGPAQREQAIEDDG